MYRFRILTAVALASVLATAANSQRAPLIYEETLEHPYSQGWYASYVENVTTNVHRIFLRGEGKLGDFIGVLYLDCAQPRYSRWEAQGGYLKAADVPAQAIAKIRQNFCK